MRLAVYAMTVKGAATLRAAVNAGVEVAYVVTGRDAGLLEDGYDEIRDTATAAGVHGYDAPPPGVEVTHAIAAGWRHRLDVPNLIVLHDSLLPRYRGFAPLPTALINGDPRVGVTAILASGEIDRGPVVAQHAVEVSYPTTILEVTNRVWPLYERITEEILAAWPTSGTAQDEAAASYSLWRDELDYRIDWRESAAVIRRKVDALGWPYMGAVTRCGPVDMKVLAAVEVDDVAVEDRRSAVGKILRFDDGDPVVVCGQGLLRLTDSVLPWPTALRTRFA